MSAIGKAQLNLSYNPVITKKIICEFVNMVSTEIARAIEADLENGLYFRKIAKKHVILNLITKFEESDEKTQRVFLHLFELTKINLKECSPRIHSTIRQIEDVMKDSGNDEGLLLSSFVFKATPILVTRLDIVQPGATDNLLIWQ